MPEGGFKWKLDRDVAFDVWQLQFKAYMSTKESVRWLTSEPSTDTEATSDAAAKAKVILAMKDPSLIRLSATARSAAGFTTKAYWDALVSDFEGRTRIKKHEIVREERVFAQKKSEKFVDYCDRAAELEARMLTAGIDTGCLVDNIILGLAEPFQRNNRDQLTKLAHESGATSALSEVLSHIRQYSRLSPTPSEAAHGVALAAKGPQRRKFTGNCHYCSLKGHMERDCRKKKADQQAGRPPPAPRDGGTSQPPAAALVCKAQVLDGVALAASHSEETGVMLYDSCCTHHLVNDKRFLTDFGPSDVTCMRMGGDEPHKVIGQGTAVLLGGPRGRVVLQKVLYVPTMVHNLCSRSQALANGAKEVADVSGFTLRRPGDQSIVLTGETGGMSRLRQRLQVLCKVATNGHASCVLGADPCADSTCGRAMAASGAVTLRLAHERLGHMNTAQVKRVAASDAVTGLKISGGEFESCITCNEAKQTRANFPPSPSRASKPLEVVHMDTIGPMQTMGFDGSWYAVPVLDDYSSYTSVLCVKSKDLIAQRVIDLMIFWQRQTGHKLLCIRSDNGTEFKAELSVWCTAHGVHRQYSAMYTPEQNGRAERVNREEIEGARALLFQRACPTRYWPFAMETKAYIKNRVPAFGKPCAPISAMFPGHVPDLSLLRVFGCSASLSVPKVKRGGKFNPVSVSGVFVGYSPHTKGWRVAVGNKVHESPSVVFREEMNGDCSVVPAEHPTDSESDDESVVDVATGAHMHSAAPDPEEAPAFVLDAPPGPAPEAGDNDVAGVEEEIQAEAPVVGADGARRSVRIRGQPARLMDEQVMLAQGTEDKNAALNMEEPYSVEGHAYAVGAADAPKSYADIANFGDMAAMWYESYDHELANMYNMKVLSAIPATIVPADEHVIDSKLDFRNKYGPNGDIVERKTRLCARGDQQQAGFDYGEVFTPMATVDTTRVLFAAAAHKGLHVHQVDVKAAYLNASLTKPVYMRPPKGDPKLQGVVWKVQKALYGLPEAGLRWHELLSKELVRYGFQSCLTDPCLFVNKSSNKCTYVLVYVDDMLVVGALSDVLRVKQQLAESFTIKDLGVAYHFLGFLVHRDEYGIRLTQEQYTKAVLQRYGYQNSHGKRTPFNEGTAKESAMRCQCASAEKYRTNFKAAAAECTYAPYDEPGIDYPEFVGKAMFLTRTRADIAYSMGVLSRHVAKPKVFHAPLVKHLLRYLHGTIDWGLFYPSAKLIRESSEKVPEHMLLYTDSDHCGEEKKRSTSGWAVHWCGCLVAWGSKLQATAVESTCAAEFVAACMGENAAMKLKDLIFEMTGEQVAAELLVDNQSAVGKLLRPAGGNMWLDLKWRVVHQRHMDKLVRIRYVPTAHQVADILTKSLTPLVHEQAVSLLGMYCSKQKAIECGSAEDVAALLRKGVKVPLKKHTCIYQGVKECVVCKAFYASFK